jgi:LAS superfamily LD-carboxypeptidase LdcB
MKSAIILTFSLLLAGSSPDAKDLPHYTKNELIGNFKPAENRDFDKVKSRYTNRGNAYLRDEVYDAFKDMWKAAKKDDINLVIISATRNKEYQTGIWNRKWASFGGPENTRAERILQYSAMPGTSRHHWGTDFDLNALENSYFEQGEGLKIYQWLNANAYRFGFFQPYTSFNAYRDVGYRLEKWHWSYYPTTQKMQRAYAFLVNYQDLNGFNGSQWAKELEVINNYVLGIEVPPSLLKP